MSDDIITTADPTQLNGHTPPEPQPLTPQEQRAAFFDTVLGPDGLEDGLVAHMWETAPNHTDWITTPAEAEVCAARNSKKNVYLSVGLAAERGADNERIEIKETFGVVGVVADVDFEHDTHKQKHKQLPPNLQAAMAIVTAIEPPPTIIVNSGHGLQCWWLYRTPWRFTSEADRLHAMRISANWQAHVHAVAAKHGYKLDSVGDLARVMRVPGTNNVKKKSEVIPTQLLSCEPLNRYTPESVETYCGDDQGFYNADTESLEHGQRFTMGNPCPVCHGYEELTRGIGERCWGFLSKDGAIAFCTREEWAGKIEPKSTSITATVYPHRMWGRCKCGETHGKKPTGNANEVARTLQIRRIGDIEAERLTWIMRGYIEQVLAFQKFQGREWK